WGVAQSNGYRQSRHAERDGAAAGCYIAPMANAASKYRSELRLVVRAAAAAIVAFLLAEGFGLPQSYWAVVTALIVVQLSLGGTIAAGLDRLAGTLAGGIFGAVAALAGKALAAPQVIVLLLTVAPLALLAALRPNFRLASVTAVIVLLATPSDTS